MSSSNKTSLGLNLWLGGDKPKRTDFCNDNTIIDKVINEHNNDTSVHVTEEDRENWYNYIYCGVYFGNGQATKTVETGCPFAPRAVLIFANGVTPGVYDGSNHYVYTAYGTDNGSTLGLTLSNGGKTLTVSQSTVAVLEKEWACLNESAVPYCYVCFR